MDYRSSIKSIVGDLMSRDEESAGIKIRALCECVMDDHGDAIKEYILNEKIADHYGA